MSCNHSKYPFRSLARSMIRSPIRPPSQNLTRSLAQCLALSLAALLWLCPAQPASASGELSGNHGADNSSLFMAAGAIRGVGTMGYGSSTPGAPPRSSFGNSPNDYRRGYEGNSPYPGDPWGREADFKARNYETRHGPQPQLATPPASPSPTPAPAPVYPGSPKPPLPGDRDFETAPPPASGGRGTAP